MEPAARHDTDRLSAVHELMSVDGDETHLDQICRTAAALFNVPIAIVTLVDETTVWVKGANSKAKEHVPRVEAFCDETISLPPGDTLVLTDLDRHPRFLSSALVVGYPRARFYAGVPISSGSGHQVGTMCVIDIVSRPDFGNQQIEQLRDLARIVEDRFREHEARRAREEEHRRRVRAETMLADREASLVSAAETQTIAEQTARFGHWRVHGANRTVSWSPGIASILDREMPSGTAMDLDAHVSTYHQDDRARILRRLANAWAGRDIDDSGRFTERARIVRPSGEIREVVVEGVCRRDRDGLMTSLHGIMLDVTDITQAECQARETNELLRATLEHMDQGLVMLGPDGRIRVRNRRARDLLDVPDDLLRVGASYDSVRRFLVERGEFIDADQKAQDWSERGGLERETRIYARRCTNGAALEIRAVPLPNGGVVRTMTDISLQRSIEDMVQESERRYRLLAENASDVIIYSDLQTIRRYVSPASKAVFGFEPEELVGTKAIDFVHPDDLATFKDSLELISSVSDKIVWRQRQAHRDGSWVWIEASAKQTRARDGTPDGYVACLRDITDRKAVEDALRDSEERLSLALDSGSDGVWDLNPRTGEVQVSGAWVSLMGYGDGGLPLETVAWEALTHPDDRDRLRDSLSSYILGRTPIFECEYRLRNKAGAYVWTHARGKVVARDARGRALRVVGTNIDVTRRKEAEKLIAHMALHDGLTDLPNRTLFKDRLQRTAAEASRAARGFAVLACDLDGFKAINDSLGHPIGDAVLKVISHRLTSVIRDCDTVARLGGDEFALILGHLEDSQDAAATARRVIEVISEPIEVDGRSTNVGVSIGIAWGSGDKVDVEALFKSADVALYRAKDSGGNTFRHFETGMDALAANRGALENDLRAAIRMGAFDLAYQPIFDLSTMSVCCFEALLRWQHPIRGPVSPEEFIPVAERTGLITIMGEWVLHEACREAVKWPAGVRVAVNVSAVQFRRPGALEQTVLSALAASGLPADRLELEITESVLVQDAEAVLACLLRLRGMNVRISLDDFGTGYSSLSYLRRFPFDKIKIDRSFIINIDDPDTAAIIRAVVGLAARVGASITAEGVESKRQLGRAREEGCTEAQGYLLSKPLLSEEVARIVSDRCRNTVAA